MIQNVAQAEAKPALRLGTVLAVFFDDDDRPLEPPLSYHSVRPLDLAGLRRILSAALLVQAASIELTLSAASEDRGEFLAQARALYRFADAAAKAGIERVTLRRSTADGRWLEVRVSCPSSRASSAAGRAPRAPVASMRDYLCKVAESVLSESEKAASGTGAPSISLRAGAEEVPLPVVAGQFRQAGGGPVLLLFFDFEGARAEARTGDRRPSLLVRAQHDPAKSYVLVRCDADQADDRRSVKAGSAGTLLKMGVTGKGDLKPDKDWTRPFSTTAEGEGVWRVVPTSDLEPGEYGLWDVQGYGVALFGVD